MNRHAIAAIYRFEMARTFRTLDAEHRLAGALDLALLRGVRRGDRLAHGRRSTASPTAPSSSPA
jgi:hypothetical protein